MVLGIPIPDKRLFVELARGRPDVDVRVALDDGTGAFHGTHRNESDPNPRTLLRVRQTPAPPIPARCVFPSRRRCRFRWLRQPGLPPVFSAGAERGREQPLSSLGPGLPGSTGRRVGRRDEPFVRSAATWAIVQTLTTWSAVMDSQTEENTNELGMGLAIPKLRSPATRAKHHNRYADHKLRPVLFSWSGSLAASRLPAAPSPGNSGLCSRGLSESRVHSNSYPA